MDKSDLFLIHWRMFAWKSNYCWIRILLCIFFSVSIGAPKINISEKDNTGFLYWRLKLSWSRLAENDCQVKCKSAQNVEVFHFMIHCLERFSQISLTRLYNIVPDNLWCRDDETVWTVILMEELRFWGQTRRDELYLLSNIWY